MNLVISKRAEREILSSYTYYEQTRNGLGERFIKAIELKLNEITLHPKRYPLKQGQYRETMIAIFPILIIYRYNEPKQLTFVSSIFHTSRNPLKKYTK